MTAIPSVQGFIYVHGSSGDPRDRYIKVSAITAVSPLLSGGCCIEYLPGGKFYTSTDASSILKAIKAENQ
jgi:hypothetical protein